MTFSTPLPRISAEQAGFDNSALQAAIGCATRHESSMNRDIGVALDEGHFGEPSEIAKTLGPTKDRADPSGVILRGGKIVAHWGDINRVDMTFSISKSYLALCAGIAVDDGLIPDIDGRVGDLVDDGGFDSDQNRDITWRHLLQLTSEWQGTLWDKPDWVDHNRDLNAKPGAPSAKGTKRQMHRPGTFWEYNDVRVNRLALALMRVFRRPLPEVLKERIMDPIGASDSWQWHGYENSWVEIDGRRMQSVSGGAHWGGGLWISTLDHARVGLLMLNGGMWEGRQILSRRWVDICRSACALNPQYGLLWWLNTDGGLYPAASHTSFFGLGVGTNMVWIDPDHDLVAIVRWIQKEKANGFIAKVMNALVS